MYLAVAFFHFGSKGSSAGISLRTGLGWAGLGCSVYVICILRKLRVQVGSLESDTAFPLGCGRRGETAPSTRGWEVKVKGNPGEPGAGGGGESTEAPEDQEGTLRCGRAEESNR